MAQDKPFRFGGFTVRVSAETLFTVEPVNPKMALILMLNHLVLFLVMVEIAR